VQPFTDRWIVYKGNLCWLYKRRGAAELEPEEGSRHNIGKKERISSSSTSSSHQIEDLKKIKEEIRGRIKKAIIISFNQIFSSSFLL
jgi:hypothetical protein